MAMNGFTSISPEEGRLVAVTERAKNIVVEAGAGTGKTTLLTIRLFNLLVDGDGIEPANILALTFTEKAAKEMSIRIREYLSKALSILEKGEVSSIRDFRDSFGEMGRYLLPFMDDRWDVGKVSARIREVLISLHEAEISTFHSFCYTLLKENCFDFQVDPESTVLDEVESRIFFGEVFSEWFEREMKEIGEDIDTWKAMFSMDNDEKPSSFHQNLLLLFRDITFEHRDLIKLDEIEGAVHRFLPVFKERFDEVRMFFKRAVEECSDISNPLYPNYNEIHELLEKGEGRFINHLNIAEDVEWLSSIPDAPKNKRYDSKYPIQTHILQDSLSEIKKLSKLFLSHKKAVHLFKKAHEFIEFYQRRKEEDGLFDFFDLLLKVREGMKNSPTLVHRLKQRFTQVLVDEFQDTDPIQADFLRLLCGDGKGGFRKGGLFIVGDPKQSIYGFRRADILSYRSFCEDLIRDGGLHLYLKENYRSIPEITGGVNYIMERVFDMEKDEDPEPARAFYTPYIAIKPTRKAVNEPRVFLLHCSSIEGNKAEMGRKAEAKVVAKRISEIVKAGLPKGDDGKEKISYNDIALLFRSTKKVHYYEEALEREGIPYIGITGSFYSSQEVNDIIMTLKAILDPYDTLSLYGSLRSPLFGFSDEELFPHFFDKVLNYLEYECKGYPELDHAFSIFRYLFRNKETMPVSNLVRELLELTGAFITYGSLFRGEAVLRNIENFIFLARKFDCTSRGGLSSFMNFIIREKIEMEGGEEAPYQDETLPSVSLLTIHRAKGLEFPVVFLCDTARKREHPERKVSVHGEWFGKKGRVVVSNPEEFRTLSYGFSEDGKILSLKPIREREEEKRILYVALTRARDYLYIVGSSEMKQKVEILTNYWGKITYCLPEPPLDEGDETKKAEIRLSDGEGKELLIQYEKISEDTSSFFPLPIAFREEMREVVEGLEERGLLNFAPYVMPSPKRAKPSWVGWGMEESIHLSLKRGDLVHRILEVLELTPSLGLEGRLHDAIDGLDTTFIGDEEEVSRLKMVLKKFIENRLAPFLEGKKVIDREVPIIFERDGNAEMRKIDLIVQDEEENLIVLDYKTGDRRSDLEESYIEQLNEYRGLIQKIFPNKRVRCMLFYIDRMEVKEF